MRVFFVIRGKNSIDQVVSAEVYSNGVYNKDDSSSNDAMIAAEKNEIKDIHTVAS